MANKNLKNAKREKNDEFYTQLTDIEKEVKHYKDQLRDKIVFCNCDDPEYSNFWKYFHLNFKHIGLKKLISTHFEREKPSYKLEYDGENITKTELSQNGDFRSPECIEILKKSDLVITNPPFSLFREYVAQLIEYEKKFLIIGNPNSITYKEIFKLIKMDKIWIGHKTMGTDMYFIVSDEFSEILKKTKKEKSGYVVIDRKIYGRAQAIWFTNLDTTKRHENLILYKKYTSEEYPRYDNYDAINVDKVSDIPVDYDGVMGVPITFLDKYNPEQFEIIDINPHFFSIIEQGLPKPKQLKITGKKDPYARILIKKVEKESDKNEN
jgi:hypothetical protein